MCAASLQSGTGPMHMSGYAEQQLSPRDLITEDDIADDYDYVICGGGLAGLVLASRLSTANYKVLVLEAGMSGDEIADRINTPSGAFYASIVGTDYDWKDTTVPQPHLNNRTISWPHGKILGGSTAMNAMYVVRPASNELDAWESIIAPEDSDAALKWGWDEMFSAMKRSENFTAPRDDVVSIGHIQWDANAYGSGGPLSVSYPGITLEWVGNWTSSLSAVGVPPLANPNNGTVLGGFVTASTINPTNWTRSSSRTAYISPLPPSSNLHILPEATVTRLNFRTEAITEGWVADAVEFAKDADSTRRTVRVKKEVILSAGVVGSPKILMLSGFGPKDVLSKADVSLVEEVPGIGQRLQDHPVASVVWKSNLETGGDIHNSRSAFANSSEFKSFINDAIAYVNLTNIFGSAGASAFQQQIQSSFENSSATISQLRSSDVIEGYKTIYQILSENFMNAGGPQVELLLSLVGSGEISVQAALQHPFSVGRLWIQSPDPFQKVLIDPGYLTHFADIITLRQGIKFIQGLGNILALNATGAPLIGERLSPGPEVTSDQDIEAWLRGSVSSQFHPSSSCGMMPREQGGVVDSKLKVYGAANVRVVDTSVFPFDFAAHLASVTFGLAEQASLIIQEESFTVPSSG
ncbi:CAZyme family AA3 [Agaricus bisporus var. burnettii]|uniref:pyranose dehydrogenase (acceptor) n=1 Tax=Agaricus bisporus var. burnettii TaxID=192524 RepID=A0A8H7CA10_AGABI|nr:CAZyme family AA3 [Agaricus bisporus var. burnettii]